MDPKEAGTRKKGFGKKRSALIPPRKVKTISPGESRVSDIFVSNEGVIKSYILKGKRYYLHARRRKFSWTVYINGDP